MPRTSCRATSPRICDVWFANEKVGYVVGVFNLILRTEDGGLTWTPFQDRTDNPQGFHLNAIASTGDALYIAGEQGLLLKWNDHSQRFAAVPTPYQGSFFGVVGKPDEVLVYGLRGNVLRSTDGGQHWTSMRSGLDDATISSVVNQFVFDPTDSNHIYLATTMGVSETRDGGEHWIKKMEGMKEVLMVVTLGMDPTRPAILYAGTSGGVYKTIDEAGHWEKVNNGLVSPDITTDRPR